MFYTWSLRIAFTLLLIGLIWPAEVKKRIDLARLIKRQKQSKNTNKYLRYLENLANKFPFNLFPIKESSNEYRKYAKKIQQASFNLDITPHHINTLKLFLPMVVFSIMLVISVIGSNVISNFVGQTETIVENFTEAESIDAFISVTEQTQPVQPKGNINIMVLFLPALGAYFLPDLVLGQIVKTKKRMMEEELYTMEIFIIILLEAGNTIIDILNMLANVTVYFRPYILACINEFYLDHKRALQNMADKVDNAEFQTIVNGLKQAVDMDSEYTVIFMNQHIQSIRKIKDMNIQKKIKKKPLIFVLFLALPLVSCLLIWMYPWFVDAMNQMKSFGTGAIF